MVLILLHWVPDAKDVPFGIRQLRTAGCASVIGPTRSTHRMAASGSMQVLQTSKRSLVERCVAVEELTVELLDRLRTGRDVGPLMSADPGALLVGNGPNDWYEGGALLTHFREAVKEYGGLQFEPGNPEAWVEGIVAWVADRVTLKFPHVTIPLRFTAVAIRDGDQWHFVQLHLSAAVADEVLLSG